MVDSAYYRIYKINYSAEWNTNMACRWWWAEMCWWFKFEPRCGSFL